jgi:hypothetical protein
MSEPSSKAWDRREFLGAASLVALALGVPAAAVHFSRLEDNGPPGEAQRALFAEVSRLVLPRTDTAGANEVRVGDFVLLALKHGLEGSRKPAAAAFVDWRQADGTLDYASWLETALARRTKGDFLKAAPSARLAAAASLDADAYASGVEFHPWRTIKALVLVGYYTSEIGGSQELRYEPVPGRWDADLPQDSRTRAISNDWTAVDFG